MELGTGAIQEHLSRKAVSQFGVGFVKQTLADKKVAGDTVQQLDGQLPDHRVAGWVGVDAGSVPGDEAGNVQLPSRKRGGMTHDAVMGADQVVAAHLPSQAAQPAHQCPRRFVKQAVHDGIAPATPEPRDVHFHAVGGDFVGPVGYLGAVAHTPHQPPVIDLQHVDIYFVVSHLLQVLHAADNGIEHAQPPIDVALKEYCYLFHKPSR